MYISSIDCLWLTMWAFLQPRDRHSVSNLGSWILVNWMGLSQVPRKVSIQNKHEQITGKKIWIMAGGVQIL